MLSTPHNPDPLPTLTARIMDEGVRTSDLDPACPDRTRTVHALAVMLRQASAVVSALSTDDKTYTVRLSPSERTASTNMASREVVVGLKPLLDPALTLGQRVSMAVAMAYHEVGHVIYSAKVAPRPVHVPEALAHRLYNIAQDVHLEARLAVTRPGFAPSLATKAWYYGNPTTLDLRSRDSRQAALIGVALYRDSITSIHPAQVRWVGQVEAWAERCRAEDANTNMLALVAEAFALIDAAPIDEQPDPEPDPDEGEGESDEGEGESGEGESEPGEGEPGEGEPGEGESPDSGSAPDATEPKGEDGEPGKPGKGESPDSEPEPTTEPAPEDASPRVGPGGQTGPLDPHDAPDIPDPDEAELAREMQRGIDTADTLERAGRGAYTLGGKAIGHATLGKRRGFVVTSRAK